MKIRDISERDICIGDEVFVLDAPRENCDIVRAISNTSVGRVVGMGGDINREYVQVEILGECREIDANKVSKINTKDSVDDIIVRLAQDIELLHLNKESEILDSMLSTED